MPLKFNLVIFVTLKNQNYFPVFLFKMPGVMQTATIESLNPIILLLEAYFIPIIQLDS